MRRAAVALAVASTMLATLTACGSSPYCKAIEDHESTLNTLGQDKTNRDFRKYAAAYRAVATVAPLGVRKDWTKLAEVTQGVLVAHRKAGIKLQDMAVPEKLKAVSAENLALIRDAYTAFNDTDHEREAVVKSAKDECEISLS